MIVDVYQAKLFLEAAAAGEPLHVEAEYEARAYELTDARGDSDGNGWTYRVSMRAKRRGWVRVAASAFNTRPIPEIRVRLPRGTPLRLDGRILEGEADLELAHLTITEAQFEARSGAMLVGVAEPLPLPLERFEIQLRFGGLQVRSLGNASPRSFRFEQSFGGAAIDLAGAWANDADVELVCSRSGVVFRLPANARAQGFDESGTERDGQYSVELTSGTVDIDADLSGCSMASGPSKGAVRVAWP